MRAISGRKTVGMEGIIAIGASGYPDLQGFRRRDIPVARRGVLLHAVPDRAQGDAPAQACSSQQKPRASHNTPPRFRVGSPGQAVRDVVQAGAGETNNTRGQAASWTVTAGILRRPQLHRRRPVGRSNDPAAPTRRRTRHQRQNAIREGAVLSVTRGTSPDTL
ncbi:MAG: hypothetical protein ACLTMP_08480 [Eggerthella lenta]